MGHAAGKRPPLAWALVLLLWGIQLLGTGALHVQLEEEEKYISEVASYFPPTMEFAQHMFNQESKDLYAFRMEHILSIQRVKSNDIIFFMTLQLRRTICRKFEEDLDSCPFQDSPDHKSVIICAFKVSTLPWTTDFQLLNKNCSTRSH